MRASRTPCESSVTVSASGHLVAFTRRRRSASSASAKLMGNGRISVSRGMGSFSLAGQTGRGEEIDEQLRDAIGLVVVDPVRGIGQALDAIEVRYVVVVGLGQIFTEVA